MKSLLQTYSLPVTPVQQRAHTQEPASAPKHMLASFSQLLVLQRMVNRPRGHKCLMT